MNPARATSFFRTNIHNIHRDGSILCQALTFFFNDRGNPSPSPSTTNTDSLPESLQFSEDGSMPALTPSFSRRASSSAENKKAQDRWSKEEEKLLVQLWAEKHDQLESRESQGANSMVLCFVHRFCS